MVARAKSVKARQWAETVLTRAVWLDEPDRNLLEQVIGRGVEPHNIARVAGVTCRAVQRRLNVLSKRLTDPQAVLVMRYHDDWPVPLGHIALDVWVRRRPYRNIARELNMTYYQVRQYVQQIRGMIEALNYTSTPPRLKWTELIPPVEDD